MTATAGVQPAGGAGAGAQGGSARFNVGSFLPEAAARQPADRALIFRRHGGWRDLSFAALDRLSDAYAHGLAWHGIEAGHKVLLMVRSGPEFVALAFAVFKMGAIPVLIDPGMGLSSLLRCVQALQPDALVAIPAVHLIRTFTPRVFRSVKKAVSVGIGLPGAPSLERIADRLAGPFPCVDTARDDTAAILFTSGSTGPAKGVVYRHGIFAAQVDALRQMYVFESGTIDMPGFPLFALFSTALGVTCLIPELDPSRPATCDPRLLVDAIREFSVHSAQGSPAIWTRVARYCAERGIELPSLRRVITFGAPIPVSLIKQWHAIMPDGEIYTPYGATESLPVSTIDGRTIVSETAAASAQGTGTCVGLAAPGIEIRIMRITDEPVETWDPALELPQGEVGEVIVRGEVVTWSYHAHPEATRASKIRDGQAIWHRLGDLGYLDAGGRLWFCGRKAHRVEGSGKLYLSVNAEGMVDPLEGVARSALVGVGPAGQQEPVLIIEPTGGRVPDAGTQAELKARALAALGTHPLYRDIRRVLFHPAFPVDPRHNAKIHREELAAWAAGQPA